MTCIAVVKSKRGKVIMAGDRRLTWDWSQAMTMPGAKIRKDKATGILIGAAGTGNICTVFINILKVPKIEVDDPDVYMFFKFKPALEKALMNAGYQCSAKRLKIPADDECQALVAIQGRVYMVDVVCPDPEFGGLIQIEESPMPMAVGCGSSSAIPILLAERKREGYSTKEHLQLAMEIAADLSPGVDGNVDFISE